MVQQDTSRLFMLSRQTDHCMCLTCDRIAQVSTINLAKHERTLLTQQIEITHQDLVGVTQTLVNLTTGMATIQSLHINADIVQCLRCGNRRIMESCLCILTAGATHKDLTLILAIEVQQDITRHKALLHCFRTRQTGLLIDRKQTLNGAMLNIIRS